ncbi:hypothetical protein [Clostridium sp.]|uniref:hypothetical protein n=1 Tax=Clostridium sp. TaxID=1506 RepID=UPI00261E3DEF
MFCGTEYNQEEINLSIELNNNCGYPYTIVQSKDELGHGTKMDFIIEGSDKEKA